MKNLTAKKKFSYHGKHLKAEQPFQASDNDANLLVAIGHAEWEKPKRVYQKKVIADEEKPKRTYKRRDMRAEQ